MSAQRDPRRIAEGVFLLERAHVNCYLVASGGAIVLIDAGLPRTWPLLQNALRAIGATTADIDAVLLTHGHFDHVGMCARLSDQHHRGFHVHDADRELARHPYRYSHEKPRWQYPFRYPRSIPILAGMVAAGALGVKGVDAPGEIVPGGVLPGGLMPVRSAGHTAGHCGFYLESQDILFSGDALVTLDPYTGQTGPQIVAGAATADRSAALAALDAYVDTNAALLLPGHGRPFGDGVEKAVRAARNKSAR